MPHTHDGGRVWYGPELPMGGGVGGSSWSARSSPRTRKPANRGAIVNGSTFHPYRVFLAEREPENARARDLVRDVRRTPRAVMACSRTGVAATRSGVGSGVARRLHEPENCYNSAMRSKSHYWVAEILATVSCTNGGDHRESNDAALSGNQLCEPGTTRECLGPAACTGAQACDAQGTT